MAGNIRARFRRLGLREQDKKAPALSEELYKELVFVCMWEAGLCMPMCACKGRGTMLSVFFNHTSDLVRLVSQ